MALQANVSFLLLRPWSNYATICCKSLAKNTNILAKTMLEGYYLKIAKNGRKNEGKMTVLPSKLCCFEALPPFCSKIGALFPFCSKMGALPPFCSKMGALPPFCSKRLEGASAFLQQKVRGRFHLSAVNFIRFSRKQESCAPPTARNVLEKPFKFIPNCSKLVRRK